MAEAIAEALREEMIRDPYMFVLGEDVGLRGGAFTCTKGLLELFPGRVFDTPISESAIAGAAYGASLCGSKAVAEIMYSDFSFIAMDQIINSAAKSRYMFGGQAKIPVVYRMSSGSGRQQAAQHSQSLEVLYANIPGLKVIMPSTPYDAKGLLKAAVNDNNPIIFLEHRLLYFKKGDVPEEEYVIPIGKGEIKRSGKDVTVIATGVMVERALAAATKLAEANISSEVIDLRTIKPLDSQLVIDSVKKTGRLVVVHEAPRSYGSAGELIALVVEQAFDYLNASPRRVTGHDVPTPYNRDLEILAIPSQEDIEDAVRKSLK
jgi:pyruvate dehydrogenase E1 component beta subunit